MGYDEGWKGKWIHGFGVDEPVSETKPITVQEFIKDDKPMLYIVCRGAVLPLTPKKSKVGFR